MIARRHGLIAPALVAATSCASVQRHVANDDFGRACLVMTEADTDEARDAVRPALASGLQLRWHLQLLGDSEATTALGVPVASGEHGALARFSVSVGALPTGADSVRVHLPAIHADGQRVDGVDSLDPARHLVFPPPADLVAVDVPSPHTRAPFVASEPAPKLRYVPGSGREPAPSKAVRNMFELMTLGFVDARSPGPRLTSESRRALKKWRKRNRAEFDAWAAEQDRLTAEALAARNGATQHNLRVAAALEQWEDDREQAWREVVDWPCRVSELRAGDTCEGLVFVPRPPGSLHLRFMATMGFAADDERCDFTVAGDSAAADDLPQLFAPWSEPVLQYEVAPLDYVAASYRI